MLGLPKNAYRITANNTSNPDDSSDDEFPVLKRRLCHLAKQKKWADMTPSEAAPFNNEAERYNSIIENDIVPGTSDVEWGKVKVEKMAAALIKASRNYYNLAVTYLRQI